MRNWENIKWIFEKDGTLRDIYVQNIEISDWEKLIELLNSEYKISYGNNEENFSNQIDLDYVKKMFADETGELEIKFARIDLNGILIVCHFFLEDQIEFDISPSEIKSINELNLILEFMKSVSKKLNKEITLCGENQPEFPLIKIDTKSGIEKILTEKEVENMWKKTDQNVSEFKRFKSKIIMKYFPKIFEKKIMKSANSEYKSTPKEKNVW
ncbi:hypothetical protein Q4553_13375 [Tenacibaculum soleae]|uniref:hypothetical protein n=1 Tax=Tenacibaculum soleae TaxID=447689 RepID=UPI0026E485FC|nr:hypothetical protein [Tenacibaculum soleae]MDO6745554.1 hypothetical protein [Tenacibaculum soleae]